MMHRDDPILLGAIPAVPPNDNTFYLGTYRCGAVWNQLEAAGVPEIKGVWAHEAGGSRFWLTVSIRHNGEVLGYLIQERRMNSNPKDLGPFRAVMGTDIALFLHNAKDDRLWVSITGAPVPPPTKSRSFLGRLGSPADIAEAVCFLASPGAAWITGETLNVNGGMHLT